MSRSIPTSIFLQDTEAQLHELMRRGLQGDAVAHGEMLQALAHLLRRFYRRRLSHDHAEVEDLVQETLIAIHCKRATYDPTQPFTAWAYAIARYKLIDYLRRQRVRITVSIDDCTELFAVEVTNAEDATRDVRDLLAELPVAQRTAIKLTRLEGLSMEEAAMRSGQSVSGIKVGVHRGLKKLSGLLSNTPDRE
ncbi:MAG: sigma-70 family RNA polymerase sigma factor [Steroidobacteraceae bacterium]